MHGAVVPIAVVFKNVWETIMGKITVTISDKASKKDPLVFEWEGDDTAIRNVMQTIDKIAKQGGVSPDKFTQAALKHLPMMGWSDNEIIKRGQVMAVLYIVLNLPTRSEDRPGSVYNYAASEDINADLSIENNQIVASLKGAYTGDDSLQ